MGLVYTRVRSTVLQPRCYKYLAFSHISRQCNSVDRARCCWWCGGNGHFARECVAESNAIAALRVVFGGHSGGSGLIAKAPGLMRPLRHAKDYLRKKCIVGTVRYILAPSMINFLQINLRKSRSASNLLEQTARELRSEVLLLSEISEILLTRRGGSQACTRRARLPFLQLPGLRLLSPAGALALRGSLFRVF